MSMCDINLMPTGDVNLTSTVDITKTFRFDLWLMVSWCQLILISIQHFLLTRDVCGKKRALCQVLIIYFCLSIRVLVEVKACSKNINKHKIVLLFANCKFAVILQNRERAKMGCHVTMLPHFRFPMAAASWHEPIPLLTSPFAGTVTGPINIALSIQTLSMPPKPKTSSNKKRGGPKKT